MSVKSGEKPTDQFCDTPPLLFNKSTGINEAPVALHEKSAFKVGIPKIPQTL